MSTLAASTGGSNRALRSRLDGSEALLRAVVRERTVGARSDVLRQGGVPSIAPVLLQVHTCRYRRLSDGYRQITAVLAPSDGYDSEAAMRGRADNGVVSLAACILGEIPAKLTAAPPRSSDRDPFSGLNLPSRALRSRAPTYGVRMTHREASARAIHGVT